LTQYSPLASGWGDPDKPRSDLLHPLRNHRAATCELHYDERTLASLVQGLIQEERCMIRGRSTWVFLSFIFMFLIMLSTDYKPITASIFERSLSHISWTNPCSLCVRRLYTNFLAVPHRPKSLELWFSQLLRAWIYWMSEITQEIEQYTGYL